MADINNTLGFLGNVSGGSIPTNLNYTPSPTNGIVTSDTGSDATIPLADNTNAGLISSTEKAKIATAIQPSDLGTVATSNDYNDLDNKPSITGLATTIYVDTQDNLKVDKVSGKSLIDDTEIIRLSTVVNFDNSGNITALADKVDKVAGKGLSTEDYTIPEKAKVTAIDQPVSSAEKITWNNKQDTLGFTPENTANKTTSILDFASTTKFPTFSAVVAYITSLGLITNVITALGFTPANKAGDTFTGAISAPNLNGTNTGDNAINTQYSGLAASKQDVPTLGTGAVISFTVQKQWNTIASPTSSNITDNLTGAVIMTNQKIYHNSGTTPSFPSGWVKRGTGNYVTGVLNTIYAEWSVGTTVEYWITQ